MALEASSSLDSDFGGKGTPFQSHSLSAGLVKYPSNSKLQTLAGRDFLMFCVPGVNLAHEVRTIAKHEVQKLRAEIRELRTGTGSTAVLAKA